jgi:formamidopyrimidine-DNA glycosylase
VLFLARVHPARRAASLTPAETDRIRKAISQSLARTLAMNRGDKITYVEESKRTENPFLIYGKAKSPCPTCRTPLRRLVIGGRTSAFCPRCQPRSGVAVKRGVVSAFSSGRPRKTQLGKKKRR